MNSIVKREQRNRAFNTHWVRNASAVFGVYPTNAPPTLTSPAGPTAEVALRPGEQYCSELPVIDC